MVDYDFLRKLDRNDLKEIAKKEGLSSITRNYDKGDLIRYLEEVLTLSKVKEYEKYYSEREIERDIHIHERIREKKATQRATEITRISINRSDIIVSLQNLNVDKRVLEQIANYIHETPPTGSIVKLYNQMSDKFLTKLEEIFINKVSDINGRNFEFRCANYLCKGPEKSLSKIAIRQRFPKVGEIDIAGYDGPDNLVVIAECKDKPVTADNLEKWISNVSTMARENSELDAAYLLSSRNFTQGVIDRLKNNNDINTRGQLKVKTGIVGSKKVDLTVYDVRDDKFVKLFPK